MRVIRISSMRITIDSRRASTGRVTALRPATSCKVGTVLAAESFQTPLATLHAFNGWADLFVVNPGGLKDAYVGASAEILLANMSLIYHDFKPDTGGGTYGTEIDFAAKWAITGRIIRFSRS